MKIYNFRAKSPTSKQGSLFCKGEGLNNLFHLNRTTKIQSNVYTFFYTSGLF